MNADVAIKILIYWHVINHIDWYLDVVCHVAKNFKNIIKMWKLYIIFYNFLRVLQSLNLGSVEFLCLLIFFKI